MSKFQKRQDLVKFNGSQMGNRPCTREPFLPGGAASGKLLTGNGLVPRKRAGQHSAMKAYWFTDHEQGGFPLERAALGSCDLSVLHIAGEWQWLVKQEGRDMAEGASSSCDDARREAEAVALKLLDLAP
jgi:hypothetical protein